MEGVGHIGINNYTFFAKESDVHSYLHIDDTVNTVRVSCDGLSGFTIL